MKITIPPGLFTDDPDLSSDPFWLAGNNIRFYRGAPETIGVFGKALNNAGTPVPIVLPSTDRPKLWVDDGLTVAGAGDRISRIDVEVGTISSSTLAGVVAGRWWFDSTETNIIAGKSGNNRVWVVPRSGAVPTILLNSPPGINGGIVAGGIVSDILVLAGGVTSVATNPPELLVRWSARRTDPAGTGGFIGFEDWNPLPTNASGEILLGSGKRIMGGGASNFGFVVWTDTGMHLLTPRTDSYVFTEEKLIGRGLLAQDAWVEADGNIWFMDSSKVLNVYDGGGVRQIPNPLYKASMDYLDPVDLDNCSMSSITRFGEVVFNYRDRNGDRRQLIYNYLEDTWYQWGLVRVAWADQYSTQPVLAIAVDGSLYLHDLPLLHANGQVNPLVTSGLAPPPSPPPPKKTDVVPEAYAFFLSTNRIPADSMSYGALRSNEMTIPRVVTHGLGLPAPTGEVYSVVMTGVGENALDAKIQTDKVDLDMMDEQSSHRVGGKTLRIIIMGTAIKSHMRWGPPDSELVVSGRK